MSSRAKKPIHHSIKERLGYERDETDEDVYADWKERTTRVCKPCWELKYCPYGPLVEQSPLLPPVLDGMLKQQQYFESCLSNGTVGETTNLTPELTAMYEEWIVDDQLLLHQALNDLRHAKFLEDASKHEDDDEKITAFLAQELPPIEIYRAKFTVSLDEVREEDFEADAWKQLQELASEKREIYQKALETGIIDNRSPLEPARRAWFEERVSTFNTDDYPVIIPESFQEASCSVFGHICPVYFTAEELTETQEARRIGRQNLKFRTMMRIVRRDDYRCQHCNKKLEDSEVEFDHIIPIAKGGNSEEHNLRLTCFGCNRDKSDVYMP